MNQKLLKVMLLSGIVLGFLGCSEGKYNDLQCDDTYKNECLSDSVFMTCKNGELKLTHCSDTQYCRSTKDADGDWVGACVEYEGLDNQSNNDDDDDDNNNNNNNEEATARLSASVPSVELDSMDSDPVTIVVTYTGKDADDDVSGKTITATLDKDTCVSIDEDSIVTDVNGNAEIIVTGISEEACEAKLLLEMEGVEAVSIGISINNSDIEMDNLIVSPNSLTFDNESETDPVRSGEVELTYTTSEVDGEVSGVAITVESSDDECALVELNGGSLTTDDEGKATATIVAAEDASDCQADISFSAGSRTTHVIVIVGNTEVIEEKPETLTVSPEVIELDNIPEDQTGAAPKRSDEFELVYANIEEGAVIANKEVTIEFGNIDACPVSILFNEQDVVSLTTDSDGKISAIVMAGEDAEDCENVVTFSIGNDLSTELLVVVGNPENHEVCSGGTCGD